MAMTAEANTIPLGLYLWKRINQIGIRTIMGVPGDFNLEILDYIYQVPNLNFIGSSNELNSAYAADGYARVNRTPGCVITTHGVGELSALNGIAGAASEKIPVIHVVGQTSRILQEKKLMIHHSIGTKPDHQLYNKVSKLIRADAAELWEGDKAPGEIDRVLKECVIQSLPVYIFMPLDLHDHQVPAGLLEKKLDLSPPIDKANEEAAVSAIVEALSKAKEPIIFFDMLVQSFAAKEAQDFVNAVKLPFFTSHGAKGVVDETHERFAGIYNGPVSTPSGLADVLHNSDQVLSIGWYAADTNGGLFRAIPEARRIDINDNHVIVNGKRFDGAYMAPLLTKLIEVLSKVTLPVVDMSKLQEQNIDLTSGTVINHNYLWSKFGDFVKSGDIVVCDTGSSQYGLPDAKFPADVHFFSQVYFGSIGYGCPAALGADAARKERPNGKGRTVLVIGDGGLMLTIQEIAVMISEGLAPVIVIINNKGYTIERAIHGAKLKYNNIPAFDYSLLLSFFGGKSIPGTNYHLASTRAELESAMMSEHVQKPKEVQIVEVKMEPFDIPWKLAGLLKARGGERMEKYLAEEGFTNAK